MPKAAASSQALIEDPTIDKGDLTIKMDTESKIEFLQRSARLYVKQTRDYWNRVYRQCRLAPSKKRDIYRRFRSKRDNNHLGALFELFVYEFLHACGCRLRSRDRGPDYKVLSPNGRNFYVEATCQMRDDLKTSAEINTDRIIQAIRTCHSDHFRLDLDVNQYSQTVSRPKLREITGPLSNWLDTLDYFDVRTAYFLNRDLSGLPKREFHIAGLRLVIIARPLSSPKSSKRSGMIWNRGGMKHVGTGENLLRKLKEKGGQVGGLRLPVCIAVNEVSDCFLEDEITAALFRFWISKEGPVNTRIAAVMFFDQVDESATPKSKPKMILNPFIRRDRFPAGLPYLDYYSVDKDTCQLKALSGSKTFHDNSWQTEWPLGFRPLPPTALIPPRS